MSRPAGYSLLLPFLLDGDAYSARDRAMFVAGYEFCLVASLVATDQGEGFERLVHRENDDRLRLLCVRLRRACMFEAAGGPLDAVHAPAGRSAHLHGNTLKPGALRTDEASSARTRPRRPRPRPLRGVPVRPPDDPLLPVPAALALLGLPRRGARRPPPAGANPDPEEPRT